MTQKELIDKVHCELPGRVPFAEVVTTRLVWNLILAYAGLAGSKDLVSLYTFRAFQFAYLKAHFKQEFYAIMAGVN